MIKTDEIVPNRLMVFNYSEIAPGSPLLQGCLKIVQVTFCGQEGPTSGIEVENTFGQRYSA